MINNYIITYIAKCFKINWIQSKIVIIIYSHCIERVLYAILGILQIFLINILSKRLS